MKEKQTKRQQQSLHWRLKIIELNLITTEKRLHRYYTCTMSTNNLKLGHKFIQNKK